MPTVAARSHATATVKKDHVGDVDVARRARKKPSAVVAPLPAVAPMGVAWAFTVLAFVVMLVPLVGMLWAPTEQTTENRVLAGPPALVKEDGSPNPNVLADAGAFFEDRFAYRNTLVDADGRLHAALLTSPTDQVVAGTGGWLYYGGSLPDYRGTEHMSEQALRNVAHSMRLFQEYCEAKGAQFLFAIAPNKNTLYAQAMPYYLRASSEPHDAERLMEYLDEYGVHHADLFELPELSDEVLYCLRDSHWTNRGAYLAANELLPGVGKRVLTVGDDAMVWMARNDFAGDLASMIYPANPGTETNYYLAGFNDGPGGTGTLWDFTEGDDVTDDWIATQRARIGSVREEGESEEDGEEDARGDGSGESDVDDGAEGVGAGESAEGELAFDRLLMYRDSFGNALVPYLASSFESAVFSKLVPYDATRIGTVEPSAVIVERAERHLDYIAGNPPVCQSPIRAQVIAPSEDDPDASETTASTSTNGPFTVVEGVLDERIAAEGSIVYVSIGAGENARTYEAFTYTVESENGVVSDFGYRIYVPTKALADWDGSASVFVGKAGELFGKCTKAHLDK